MSAEFPHLLRIYVIQCVIDPLRDIKAEYRKSVLIGDLTSSHKEVRCLQSGNGLRLKAPERVLLEIVFLHWYTGKSVERAENIQRVRWSSMVVTVVAETPEVCP